MESKYPKLVISWGVIACTVFLLFFRLGHYALWDDEATTALFAQSFWLTGDTHAQIDHNLVAYRSGVELQGLRQRYMPPLQFYLAAPAIGLIGRSAFAARLPFAICGLLTVLVMLYWLGKIKAGIKTWILLGLGIIGNVPLLLFARQCRYYSPVILATLVLVFLYFYRDGRWKKLLATIFVSTLLLSANYIAYVAVFGALIVDYLIWGRKTRPFTPAALTAVFISQLILGVIFLNIYFPLGKDIWGVSGDLWWRTKLTLFAWNLRELNSCELGVGVFILFSPLLFFYKRDVRLLRIPLGIFVYILIVSLVSTQPLGLLRVAFVRYLAPLIPFCIFTAVVFIEGVTTRWKWLALPLAIVSFGTNILHGGPLSGVDKQTHFSRVISEGRFRSTISEYVQELISPAPSAYRAAADWINNNLEEKESVWVSPDFATYPLMFHAPKATYGWQLKEKSGQFRDLPDIHFFGHVPPDYIIAFGPYKGLVNWRLLEWEKEGVYYNKIKHINLYWYDLTRPELFWHTFHEVKDFSPDSEGVYIFQLSRQGKD